MPTSPSRPRSTAATPLQRTAWLLALLLAAASSVRAAPEDPQAAVRDTTQRLLAAIAEPHAAAGPERVQRLVREILVPRVDLERVSRSVLGRYWRQASEGQRGRFIAAFRELLVRTFSTALGDYAGAEIRYVASRTSARGDEAVVRTRIRRAGAAALGVDYRLHLGAHGWRLWDVLVDGVSLLTTYRSSLRRAVRGHGVEGAIEALQARTRQAASAVTAGAPDG